MLALEHRKDFILGGHSIFTVTNPTGEYYTYRVNAVEGKDKRVRYFVGLLTGPDNTSDYTYLGALNIYEGIVVLTNASKYTKESKPYRVVNWLVELIWAGKELPSGYTMRHIGRCAACGRPLTTPESLVSGFGPICREKI